MQLGLISGENLNRGSDFPWYAAMLVGMLVGEGKGYLVGMLIGESEGYLVGVAEVVGEGEGRVEGVVVVP